MSINETLDDETIAFVRKAVSSNSCEQIECLRFFIKGQIANPILREEATLRLVLPFLEEAVDESPDG